MALATGSALALGAGVLGAGGNIAGNAIASGSRNRAAQAQQDALDAIVKGINMPTTEEQQIALQDLVSSGQLTPEMLETISQQNSAMENVSTDPRLRSAQMTALEKLTQQGQEGLTAQDRLGLNQIGKENERASQARNASILQNMAQRGMSGSGAELAAQLAGSQAASENAQERGLTIAAQAQQRALEATAAGANLSGSLRNQDFNEGSQRAQAQDAISRFNAANRQSVAQTNVGARNQAQELNLRNSQRISDENIGTANRQEAFNKGLKQTAFQNSMDLGRLRAGAFGNQAAAETANSQNTQDLFTSLGKAGAQTLGTIGSNQNTPTTQTREKTEAANRDADAMQRNINSNQGLDLPDMRGRNTRKRPGLDLGFSHGGEVPGEAKLEGDHPENDTVPAMVSPGEVVIPRSVLDEADSVIMNFIKKSRKG